MKLRGAIWINIIIKLNKSYFIIEKKLLCQIIKYTKFLSYLPLPFSLSFLGTQIINPLLISSISPNHDKVDYFRANGEILMKGIVSLF